MEKRGLSRISLRILELLRQHPSGLTSGEIRRELDLQAGEQAQLDRRRRDLYRYYQIERIGRGNDVRYVYRGEKEVTVRTGISLRVRAQVLHQSHGKCGLCGRSKDRHDISLVVDHKIPLDWGGLDDVSNLWALCEHCNAGKKNYFASFDAGMMRRIMRFESPHQRIGELLKLNFEKPVESWLIDFVAFDQDDWQKRLRELRYLGWEIRPHRKKNRVTGRTETSYVLIRYTDWPENPTKWIRDFELERAKRNRLKE